MSSATKAVDYIPPSVYPAALFFLLLLVAVLVGIVAYFLKDIRSSLKDEQAKQDAAIKVVAGDLAELKEKLPHKYVLRDDFTRAIAALDHKFDVVMKEISEINKSLHRLIGGKSQ